LTTWIYRIVTNTVLNHRRSERRKSPAARLGSAIELENVPGLDPGPEVQARDGQAAALARNILMAINEPKRMAFVLVELEGLSYAEAALCLDETPDAVRSRVRAARDEFSAQLNAWAGFRTEAPHVG
jgi:RNA polymerase sigma-70 factor (ECF subfamily)